jgi:hypothetical protein
MGLVVIVSVGFPSLVLLFLLATPASLLGPLLHLMEPLEEMLRELNLGTGNPHHIVAGVDSRGVAVAAQVVVVADHALVAEPNHRLLAPIAGHVGVGLAAHVAGLLGTLALLSSFDKDLDLVQRTLHLSESDDELLIGSNGDIVAFFICPVDSEELVLEPGVDGGELLLEIGEAAANLFVHNESTNLSLVLAPNIFQIDFK